MIRRRFLKAALAILAAPVAYLARTNEAASLHNGKLKPDRSGDDLAARRLLLVSYQAEDAQYGFAAIRH